MSSRGALAEDRASSRLWLCRDEVDRWVETSRMARRRKRLRREILGSAMHSQRDDSPFPGMPGRKQRLSRRAHSYPAFEASEPPRLESGRRHNEGLRLKNRL